MESLELIDDYFKGLLTDEKRQQVEQRIVSDPTFAEELAFYLSAHNALKEQLAADKKARFKELYDRSKASSVPRKSPIRPLYVSAAAAALVALVVGAWLLFFRHPSPQQLAERYINKNLLTLDVKMSSVRDSLQLGIAKYNDNDLTGAGLLFGSVLRHDPGNEYATQYAGLVCLRLKEYDRALSYFQQLAADTALYINPALFYQSLTLMERRLPDDYEKAEAMLHQVVDHNLDMKEEAQQLLSQW